MITARLIFSTLFLFFVGCALAPKVVHLEPVSVVTQTKFSKPVCVKVVEFKDQRKDPQLLGHTYNLGVKTSDVKTYGSIHEWVQNAYKKELIQAGSSECTAKDSLVLSGVVKEVDQSESWNINTSIKVELKLSGKGDVFLKMFEGKASQISHAASESEFTESLYKALQDLMKESVPTIVGKVEQAQ